MFWMPSKRGPSLAARLSVWYTASAFLLLLVATGFLYWVLQQSFDREDDQYLAEKSNTLATLLRAHDFRTVKWEVEGESFERPGVRVLSRVTTADGRPVVQTSGMTEELPAAAFSTARSGELRSPNGKTFRILSKNVAALPNEYQVQVALEVTFEKHLLAAYRRRLWLVLGLGLIGAIIAGYHIARCGIRPVEEIADTVRQIRSTTLSERVEMNGLPSELSALAATFNEMLDRLEEAFARLGQFSSDIAHELRTPINNLRGEVEVALGRVRSPEEYREVLGSTLEECLQLSRLIDRLLFLARAESPETQIRRERLELTHELATVNEFYGAAAHEAGVSLRVDAVPALTAELDRTLFQRAVGNLVENALAHTPPGGSVKISAVQQNGSVCVAVSDTGCGIPAEHLPHVFDRFHRVDAARSKHEGGAGLGLAIVESIAHLHGGKAQLESEVGQGTQVTLVFPSNMTGT